MKKMVNCPNWKEYQSFNGWIMFCGAGAYGRKLSVQEARNCGCTEAQRAKCKIIMENNIGYALLPDICEESSIAEKRTNLEPVKTY